MQCVIDFLLLGIILSYHINLESGNTVRIKIFDIANNTIYYIVKMPMSLSLDSYPR